MRPRLFHFLPPAITLATLVWPVSSGLAQEAAKPPVPSGNVTFSFWGIATQPWQIMIDEFEKTYPNLKIKWTKYSTDELKQALRVSSAAGKMGDAWFNWGGSLAAPYDDAGHSLELTPQLQALYGVDKNIVPAALDLARHNGKLYGIPVWVRPMTIIYKKSLFDKYGLVAPTTFDELEKVCETLKSKGVTPFAVGGKFSWMTMRTTDFLIGPFSYARITTDDRNGVVRTYVGDGQFVDDPLDTFGSRAVVEVPRLQQLLKVICKNGFEHHAAMNASHTAKILNEAFTTYFGWDTYMHS